MIFPSSFFYCAMGTIEPWLLLMYNFEINHYLLHKYVFSFFFSSSLLVAVSVLVSHCA